MLEECRNLISIGSYSDFDYRLISLKIIGNNLYDVKKISLKKLRVHITMH